MTRSFCRLWTHAVFVTKHREALIDKDAEVRIYNHLSEQLRRYECVPLIINGMPEHIHLLFQTNYKMALADIFQKVKGETSFWINKNGILKNKFSWQDGSFACGISEDDVASVKTYIANQKLHHAKKTFRQEYEEFIAVYGPELVPDNRGF